MIVLIHKSKDRSPRCVLRDLEKIHSVLSFVSQRDSWRFMGWSIETEDSMSASAITIRLMLKHQINLLKDLRQFCFFVSVHIKQP